MISLFQSDMFRMAICMLKPSLVGAVARDAGAGRLVNSHFMPAIVDELDAAIARIREVYYGPIDVAEDLATYAIEV